MKKKELLAGTVLLAASSALSAPDEKGGRTAEKATGEGQGNEQINIPQRSRVYIPKSSKL
jgi:hypothetical protein